MLRIRWLSFILFNLIRRLHWHAFSLFRFLFICRLLLKRLLIIWVFVFGRCFSICCDSILIILTKIARLLFYIRCYKSYRLLLLHRSRLLIFFLVLFIIEHKIFNHNWFSDRTSWNFVLFIDCRTWMWADYLWWVENLRLILELDSPSQQICSSTDRCHLSNLTAQVSKRGLPWINWEI